MLLTREPGGTALAERLRVTRPVREDDERPEPGHRVEDRDLDAAAEGLIGDERPEAFEHPADAHVAEQRVVGVGRRDPVPRHLRQLRALHELVPEEPDGMHGDTGGRRHADDAARGRVGNPVGPAAVSVDAVGGRGRRLLDLERRVGERTRRADVDVEAGVARRESRRGDGQHAVGPGGRQALRPFEEGFADPRPEGDALTISPPSSPSAARKPSGQLPA